MSGATHFRLNEPHVIGELLEGELVLVNFESGCYYSLRETGADVLYLLRSGRSLEQTISQMALHYQLPTRELAADIERFAQQLCDEHLLVPAEWSHASTDLLAPVAAAYGVPLLEKFDDMAEQLLLDPIHEIDQSTWLMRKVA